MYRAFLILVLTPLAFLTSAVHAANTGASQVAAAVRPVALVRIQALEGTGPDLREHRLFAAPEGFVTTLDALGRVGYQVSGAGLDEGGYHTLFVQLADEYERVQADGTRVMHRFSEENRPTRLRVRGMIMVRDGQATPLRMLDEPRGHSARGRGVDGFGMDDD